MQLTSLSRTWSSKFHMFLIIPCLERQDKCFIKIFFEYIKQCYNSNCDHLHTNSKCDICHLCKSRRNFM